MIRLLTQAAALAAALTLPLMLINLPAFWNSVVTFQVKQPFRADALSYLALMAGYGIDPPLWLGFFMLLPALALALYRAPRTASGFAAAAALTYLAFFAFSKQAFCNYYFFIIGALCSAAAATCAPSDLDEGGIGFTYPATWRSSPALPPPTD